MKWEVDFAQCFRGYGATAPLDFACSNFIYIFYYITLEEVVYYI